MLVALVVLVGGFYVALTKGVGWVSDQFQGPDDFAGPGTGSVEFTVNEGDVVAEIGRNLKAAGSRAAWPCSSRSSCSWGASGSR